MVIGAEALIHIPQKMNYQGQLTNSSGTPINTPRSITFCIYDAATGGTALWTETQGSVSVINGIFNVVLGSNNAIDIPFRKAYWLGINVASDGEMTPRHLLTNAAYAMASRKIVYQEVLTVAHDGGDTCTVSAAIDMLLGQGPFTGAGPLVPAPSINTQWVINVQAGTYNETSPLHIPGWVTVRGQGWDATELVVNQVNMSNRSGVALESLMITSGEGANPVVNINNAVYCYVRECKIEAVNPAIVIDLNGAQSCDIVENYIFMMGPGAGGGIGISSVINCRVEDCVIDLINTNPVTSWGISDMGLASPEIYILENTIKYVTLGGPATSFGIGLSPGGTGRVSYNVFNMGMPARDIIDPATNMIPVGGPNGICNQDSLGAEIAAF
jgi:hypothetical protein